VAFCRRALPRGLVRAVCGCHLIRKHNAGRCHRWRAINSEYKRQERYNQWRGIDRHHISEAAKTWANISIRRVDKRGVVGVGELTAATNKHQIWRETTTTYYMENIIAAGRHQHIIGSINVNIKHHQRRKAS